MVAFNSAAVDAGRKCCIKRCFVFLRLLPELETQVGRKSGLAGLLLQHRIRPIAPVTALGRKGPLG